MASPLEPVYAERRARLGDYFAAVHAQGNGTVKGFVEPLACALAGTLFEGDSFPAPEDLRDFLGMDQLEWVWVFREGEETSPDLLTPAFVAGKLLRSITYTHSGVRRVKPLKRHLRV